MKQDALRKGISELSRSIEVLYRVGLLLPSLMMSYATIDILAGLARPAGATESTNADFRTWVKRYFLPGSRLVCTEDDLWAARCSLLHTYTSESRDSRMGKARKLLYAAGQLEESARATTDLIVDEYVIVISRDFFDALSTGLQRFFDDLGADTALSERVMSRAGQFLVSISC